MNTGQSFVCQYLLPQVQHKYSLSSAPYSGTNVHLHNEFHFQFGTKQTRYVS